MARDSGRDVREEIRIALFWRALIGDYEYIKFDPDDMTRWYDALEMRGALEIRHLMRERYATRPVNAVLGIVSGAPHPPTWLVRDWLSFHEQKGSSGHWWLATAGFVTVSMMMFPLLHQCAALTPVSMYVMQPPDASPQLYAPIAPTGSTYMTNGTAPPTTFTPGQTSAQSTGIAGAAMGVAPPGGTTGAVNGGISAGSISAAPAMGGLQQ